MPELIWSDEARYDLDEIVGYIEQRDEAASLRLRALIETSAERIRQFPLAFRSGRVAGTRDYVLVFTASETFVRILAVLHVRQQYP